MSKNNDKWIKILDEYNVLQKLDDVGSFIISADEIRNFREPRLMTKFDCYADLPEVFKKNNLSILPISRNKYVLSRHNIFTKIEANEKPSEIKSYQIPEHLQSIKVNQITSEAVALNCAYICQILSDFIGDVDIVPTINGRMGTTRFDFNIANNLQDIDKVSVENSQIEIDGAYEGVEYLTIIEAKRRITDDFITRQLYYPYRTLATKVSKPIKLIYLLYSNGVFSLREYAFDRLDDYNSIKIVKHIEYRIEEFKINIISLIQLLKATPIVVEPLSPPFPQADRFERIINICELIHTETRKKEDFTDIFQFDKRQTDYYLNACKYLGLVEETKKEISLNQLGQKVITSNFDERHKILIQQILSHAVFSKSLEETLDSGKPIETSRIVEIMKECKINVTGATFKRRAMTVKGWVNWILSLLED